VPACDDAGMPEEPEVRAAGAAVWRRRGAGTEWAVIHRPRYDDWSLAKGKLDAGEDFQTAAVREVEEEIGVRGALGAELPPTRYRDGKGRSKLVRYWLMEAPASGNGFTPNDEVDELRWLPAAEALELLTYSRDRDLLAAAVEALG
jgi:8-oxo-dGTP pyrophosphatase MutT (NUDIX family)